MSPNTTPMEPTAKAQNPTRPCVAGAGAPAPGAAVAAPVSDMLASAVGGVVVAKPGEAVVAPGMSPAIKVLLPRSKHPGAMLNGGAHTPKIEPVQWAPARSGL